MSPFFIIRPGIVSFFFYLLQQRNVYRAIFKNMSFNEEIFYEINKNKSFNFHRMTTQKNKMTR